MMEVQKYLKEYGLEKLKSEFSIVATDYSDFVVLNYNQIESLRFNPVVDECRALILEKGTWNILARSFDRFYNWQESVQDTKNITLQRIASLCEEFKNFDVLNALVQEKVDGSLLSVWNYKNQWNVSTRKMGFGEGSTTLGNTFAELFWSIASKYNLKTKLDEEGLHNFTIVFEMVSPETRIVTPYEEKDITLIGVRNNISGREFSSSELDRLSNGLGIKRPKSYKIDSLNNLFELVNEMPCMEEGVVLVIENGHGSHWRVKVKNAKYLAIANMRNNGNVSPKRILTLIKENEHHEYLRYFPCDQRYFDLVESECRSSIERINYIWDKVKHIEDQKEFALTMIPLTKFSFEKGLIFSVRKNKTTVEQEIKNVDVKNLEESMNLKNKFIEEFGIKIEVAD